MAESAADHGGGTEDKTLFKLARLLVQLFERIESESMSTEVRVLENRLAHQYQRLFRKNIRWRDYGCAANNLHQKLPIFERHRLLGKGIEWELSLSKPKLLQFLFTPVLRQHGGSLRLVRISKCLQEVTGFDVDMLCKTCNVGTLDALVQNLAKEIKSFQIVSDGSKSLLSLVSEEVPSEQLPLRSVSVKESPAMETQLYPYLPPPQPSLECMTVPQEPLQQQYSMLAPNPQTQDCFSPLSTLSPDTRKEYMYNIQPRVSPDPVTVSRHPPIAPQHHAAMLSGKPIHEFPLDSSTCRRGVIVPGQSLLHPSLSVGMGTAVTTPHPAMIRAEPQNQPAAMMIPGSHGMPPPLTTSFPNPAGVLEGHRPRHPLYYPDMDIPKLSPRVSTSQFVSSARPRDGKEVVEKVNAKLEEIIQDLSSQGKYVPECKVKEFLDRLLQNENKWGRNRVSRKDIAIWSRYSMAHGRVDELIRVFCWFNPISSLCELQQAIITAEGVDSFETLQMGPLLRHPRVVDFFKPPSTLEAIPDITSYRIHKHLMEFISRRPRTEGKLSMEEFLEYICKKEEAETKYHLCIRISSFPLAIQINFKFRSNQRQMRIRGEEEMRKEMAAILDHETEKLRKRLTVCDDPLSMRRNLGKKDTVQILIDVFEAFRNHFSSLQQNKISNFLHCVTQDHRMRRLFLLAIYEGAFQLPLDRLLSDEENTQEQILPKQERMDLFYQHSDDVLAEVLKHLDRAPFPVDLASLARVEDQIAGHFNAPMFQSLGQGSFLHFLATQEKAVKALGGTIIGSCLSSAHTSIIKGKVLRLISQLNSNNRKDKEVVVAAIKMQFGVDSVEDLGCGTVEKLMTEQEILQLPPTSIVSYLTPLFLNGTEDSARDGPMTDGSAGILGFQEGEDAIACLQKAPLLEDLKQWSHWDLIYKPYLGDLAEFLRSEAVQSIHIQNTVHAMELTPGHLIRICPTSTISDFIQAIETADPVSTAGHLVSMVVKAGSVYEIPTQLLAKHVETGLEKMSANRQRSATSISEAEGQKKDIASEFVFHCLMRIPAKICHVLANGIFLDSLRKVISSSAIDGLLKYCKTPVERRFLQSLGMTTGIKAWIDDFKTMLKEAEKVQLPYMYKTVDASHGSKMVPVEPAQPLLTTNSPLRTFDVEAKAKECTLHVAIPITNEELLQSEVECKAIIDSIRHDEFGIGIELDERQREIAQKQRSREGRGLQRLSLELYSKDTHFVLELIQNADDNRYPDFSLLSEGTNRELPSLKFVVSNNCITILNNEVGFFEINIRAICDVGRSTKGSHRFGYIGQKGIGFKSVFRVTDSPEIHSNGYHIKFDATSDAIGYILPIWIEQNERSAMTYDQSWTTGIVLPLKENLQTSTTARKFYDIQPSLLLFLHRLRNIIVEDQVSEEVRHMARSDVGHGITEIHHNDGHERWLVVRRKLTDTQQYKPDVEATELALAFPLPPKLEALPLAKDLHPQQVFAFLPLRSYGFRFIIQGDFDLPSSREDVNSDSAWNQWLREEIPSLFVEAMDKMKEVPGMSEVEAVALFLQFVPLEGEVHDFFKPVTSRILQHLRGRNCLPSDPVAKEPLSDPLQIITSEELQISPQSVAWKHPSELIFVEKEFVRENIPQALLTHILHISYLNSDLLRSMNMSLRAQLGLVGLTIDHLITTVTIVLESFHNQKTQYKPDNVYSDISESDSDSDINDPPHLLGNSSCTHRDMINWVANWLACVHITMEDTRDTSSASINKLRQLSVIPVSDGSFVAAQDGSLFFQTDSNQDSNSGTFRELFKEMRVVDSFLFDLEDELARSRVHRLLEMLGVKNLYPVDIIKHHILPQFNSGRWKDKTSGVLCIYLMYIKENIGQLGVSEAEMVHLLRDCVVIVTAKHGPKQPSKEVIHFSSEYNCKDDLLSMFPDVNWTVVSPVYLRRSKNGGETNSWKTFFIKLGVKPGITVERVDEHVSEGTPRWSELREHLKRSPDNSYTIRNYHSREFNEIVNSVKGNTPKEQHRQMSMLAEFLDRQWEAEYRQYTEARYFDGANENELGCIASSFQLSLTKLPWLPAKPCATTPSTFTPKPLYRGHELYDNIKSIKNLLSIHVPYIGAEVNSPSFVNLLQIKGAIGASEMMHFLREWSRSCEGGMSFSTSIAHMREVYCYLNSQIHFQDNLAPAESIKEAIQEEQLVFMPDTKPSSEEYVSPGHFYSIHKVCWLDPTTVLYRAQNRNEQLPPDLPKILQPHYRSNNQDIKQAFIAFGAAEVPNVASLIALMKYVSSTTPSPEVQQVEDFTMVAFQLVEACRSKKVQPSFVYNQLSKAKVFPTQDHKWVSLEEGVLFENDSPELAKRFKDEDIHFLRWPKEIAHGKHRLPDQKNNQQNQELREEFLKICKIPSFSTVVHTKVVPEGVVKPLNDFLIKLHHYVPLIQRFLMTNCVEEYALLKENTNIDEKLQHLSVFSVTSLQCVYSVSHDGKEISAPSAPSPQGCELEDGRDSAAIYIVDNKIKGIRLVPALVKLFQNHESTEKFEDFLKTLLLEDPVSDADKEEIENKYSLLQIPEGEPAWSTPMPDRQQMYPEKEDENSESEMEEPPEQSHDHEAAPQEEGGLKSWPPRSAVDLEELPARKKQKSAAAWPPPEIESAPSNMIGEEEIKWVQRKHMQDYPEVGVEGEPTSHDHRYPPSRQSSTVSSSRTHVYDESETVTAPQQMPDSPPGIATKPSQHQHPPLESTADTLQPQQGHTAKHSSGRKSVHPAQFSDQGVADIASLMQKASLEGLGEHLLPLISEDDIEARKFIGRWGEEFVYTYLKTLGQLPDGRKIQSIQWVNEEVESLQPYDIVVHVEAKELYIEVKSTSSSDKELVAVSWKELKFAEEQSENYQLYRVYNAGKASRQLCWLENLHGYLQNKPIRFLFEL